MALIEYKRLISKSGNGIATIPASPSHDNGDWIATDVYENELYVDEDTNNLYIRRGDSIILIGNTGTLQPAIDFAGAVGLDPPTELDGDVYVLTNETGDPYMDVSTIEWVLGTTNGVKYTFSSFAMLTSGAIAVGDYLHVTGATNPLHNGKFPIISFDVGAGWVRVDNPEVVDATEDEAASPAVAHFTKAAWDGAAVNDIATYHSGADLWVAITPTTGQLIVIMAESMLYIFDGTNWIVLIPDASETVKGIIEIATSAETITGTDATRAVVPSALTAWWTNIKTVIATISAQWIFTSLWVRNSLGAAFKTRIDSAAVADQTWTIPGEGDQTFASRAYADALVIGLWDDRGNYDASVNAYPSSGGSGGAGAILKGDIWTVSVVGTLPTGQIVELGDTVRALIDTPGNVQANWAIAQNNVGYVPEQVLTFSAPLSRAVNTISIPQATRSVDGYIDSEDFIDFQNSSDLFMSKLIR